jgi:hypothetical protein
MPQSNYGPTAVQAGLLEHLAGSGMRQLNEIRRVLGVSEDMGHDELIAHLRTLVSRPETPPA